MFRRVAAALVILGLAAGPARAAADRLVPLVAGWEQYFKLEWESSERGGQPVVRGYVLNDWGMPAARMQLLVEALDTGGNVVAQRVAWVGAGILMPGVRAYFEVPVAERSPGYRVSVFAFDWVQVGGAERD
jgi:hypothetical protein